MQVKQRVRLWWLLELERSWLQVLGPERLLVRRRHGLR